MRTAASSASNAHRQRTASPNVRRDQIREISPRKYVGAWVGAPSARHHLHRLTGTRRRARGATRTAAAAAAAALAQLQRCGLETRARVLKPSSFPSLILRGRKVG
ncbi:uncharacterized [Tachysurus ichikawai]